MDKYDFSKLPDSVRSVVELRFGKYASIIPAWCREISFLYNEDPANKHQAMTVVPIARYGRAIITIHPAWLEESEEMQLHGAIHELVHLQLEPIAGQLQALAGKTCDRDTVSGSMVHDDIIDRIEQTVESVTALLKAGLPMTSHKSHLRRVI